MDIRASIESIRTKIVSIPHKILIALIRPLLVFAIICIVSGMFLQFNKPWLVTDNFMSELLKPNDLILVSKQAYSNRDIRFGDVVLHYAGSVDSEGGYVQYCNRVIGMPGDEIEIKDARIIRNGVRMDEPYVLGEHTFGEMDAIIVPAGCYFVLGDNRFLSIDSRDDRVGLVTRDQIQGKVVFRLLPVSRAGDISLE